MAFKFFKNPMLMMALRMAGPKGTIAAEVLQAVDTLADTIKKEKGESLLASEVPDAVTEMAIEILPKVGVPVRDDIAAAVQEGLEVRDDLRAAKLEGGGGRLPIGRIARIALLKGEKPEAEIDKIAQKVDEIA